MIKIRVKLDTRELDKIVTQLPLVTRKIRTDLRRLGHATVKYMHGTAPVSNLNKPHLRDSFSFRTRRYYKGAKLLVRSSAVYAQAIDTGATIPTRYPRTKRAMKWTSQAGNTIFAQRARGFRLRGTNYVTRTGGYMRGAAPRFIDYTLKRYIRR